MILMDTNPSERKGEALEGLERSYECDRRSPAKKNASGWRRQQIHKNNSLPENSGRRENLGAILSRVTTVSDNWVRAV
jgi:hypothetical protein